MDNDFATILENATKEVLTDNTRQLLKEAFDAAVAKKVQNRLELQLEEVDRDHALKVTALVDTIDKKHAKALETLVENIDEDHTKKVQNLVAEMDKSYTNKLKLVKEHYELKQQKELKEFKDTLLESLSDHIDNEIDERIPAHVFHNAAKAYLEKNKKAVVKESRSPARSQKRSLVTESQETLKKNDGILLEALTKNFDAEKKNYILSKLGEKSEQFIKENFDYVCSMFDHKMAENKKVLAESAKRQALDSQKNMLLENESEVSENNEPSLNPVMASYVAGLKRLV